MHTGGQNDLKKNEIQLSAFTLTPQHELTSNITYFFEMEGNVQIMRLDHRPGENVYSVYVLYKEMGKQSEFGRVLQVNLGGDVSQAKVFDFTDRVVKLADNDISRSIHAVGIIGGDNYVYAGTTNAMPNITDISLAFTDWTADAGKKYGFIASTSDSSHCQSEAEDAITFGINFQSKFEGKYKVK